MTYAQRTAYIEKLRDYRSIKDIAEHKMMEHDLLELIIRTHYRDADFENDCDNIKLFTSFRHPDLPQFS